MLLLALMTLLFSLLSPCARLYTEHYAGPQKGDASNVYSMFYGAVIALITFALNGLRFQAHPATVLLGLVNGAVLVVYTTALVHASAQGPYSFMMLCAMFGGLLVPTFGSILFMGETISGMQIVAVALMLLAFVCMNLQGLSFRGEKPKKAYFVWCAALFLSNGVYCYLMSAQQALLEGAERCEMIVVTYTTTALLVLAWQLIRKPKGLARRFRMGKKALLFASLACLIAATATNLLVYLLSAMDSVTVLYAIDNGGVLLFSGLYSFAIFHEKPTVSQFAGMALALVSIVMLSVL